MSLTNEQIKKVTAIEKRILKAIAKESEHLGAIEVKRALQLVRHRIIGIEGMAYSATSFMLNAQSENELRARAFSRGIE